MRILIVDDQADVVRGIHAGVNWDLFPVEEVLEAYSGRQAIELLRRREIELVISDIEMPYISGLDLAAWIERERPQTAVVFLTAHADFSYAQKAILLGCKDYIVQPVDYRKLEASILSVIRQIQDKRSRSEIYEKGLKWNEMESEMRENFWRKLTLRSVPLPFLEVERESRNIDLTVDWEARYRMLMVCLLGQVRDMNHWREDDTGDRMEEITCRRLDGKLPVVSRMAPDEVNVIYILKSCAPERALQAMVEEASAEDGCDLACYLSGTEDIYNLYRLRIQVDQLKLANSAFRRGVFSFTDGAPMEPLSMRPPDFWLPYLEPGQGEQMKGLILREMEEVGCCGRQDLDQLAHAIFSAWCSVRLRAERTDADMQINREILTTLKSASDSRENFLAFLDRVLADVDRAWDGGAAEAGCADDLIRDVKAYIEAHLDGELSRQEIASHVFVSKDYLSHTFRAREGARLVDYINGRRIERAKALLRDTNLPLTDVAQRVGLGNYSYFTKLFRRLTGISATEFKSRK